MAEILIVEDEEPISNLINADRHLMVMRRRIVWKKTGLI